MTTKLQGLIDQIYRDGMEKAQSDSEKVLVDAKERADAIIRDAKQEAESIVRRAQEEKGFLENTTEAELKLAVSRAVSELKRRIENLVSIRVVGDSLDQISLDVPFLKELILSMTNRWQSEAAGTEVSLLVPEEMRAKLEQALKNSIGGALDGIEVDVSSEIERGFRIAKKGESFYIDFSDRALLEFFIPFLREKTATYLTGQND